MLPVALDNSATKGGGIRDARGTRKPSSEGGPASTSLEYNRPVCSNSREIAARRVDGTEWHGTEWKGEWKRPHTNLGAFYAIRGCTSSSRAPWVERSSRGRVKQTVLMQRLSGRSRRKRRMLGERGDRRWECSSKVVFRLSDSDKFCR